MWVWCSTASIPVFQTGGTGSNPATHTNKNLEPSEGLLLMHYAKYQVKKPDLKKSLVLVF